MACSQSRAWWRLVWTVPCVKASRVSRAAPGLSSTSRISIGRIPRVSASVRLGPIRNGEGKDSASSGFGGHAHLAAMALDDLLTERQSNPGAGILVAAVKTLEHLEDPFVVLLFDPDPVVSDAHRPVPILVV